MIFIHLFVFIITFISVHVSCLQKKTCDFDNSACLLEAEKRLYANALSDATIGLNFSPIHLDAIETNLTSVKYTLHNASLMGLIFCDIKQLRILREKKEYNYYLQCPHLTTEAYYEVTGILNNVPMHGKGNFKATQDDYHLYIIGNYEKEFDDDKKLHLHLTDFTLNIEAKGNVVYKYDNLFNGDTKKSDEFHQHFTKENWKTVDKILGEPVMKAFLNEFIQISDKFLKLVPIEDIYYYYE